jgi:glycosyltransferase involved in cell wall biosynthesis
MRILFLANTPPDRTLGAPGCDLATIDALRELGHQVDDFWNDSLPHKIRHPNLHQLLELPSLYASFLNQHLMTHDYDVIQVNQPHAWRAAYNHQIRHRQGIFVNRSHGWEPFVRTSLQSLNHSSDRRPLFRKLLSSILTPLLERHNELVLRYSDGVVLCSVDDKNYILKNYPQYEHKFRSVSPGIDPLFFKNIEGTCSPRNHAPFRLLYAGSFMPQKGPEIVAKVFSNTLKQIPESTATWICPESAHAQAMELLEEPIRSRVRFSHWMSKERLALEMDSSHIFLFPSYFEGFAQTFLQAMSRGCCVVTTNIDGMGEAITHWENGILHAPGDWNAMTQSVLELARNRSLCEMISRSAREKAVGYTWEKTAITLIAFYQELLRSKNNLVRGQSR